MSGDTNDRAPAASELGSSYTRSAAAGARQLVRAPLTRCGAKLTRLIGGYGVVIWWCVSSAGCCHTLSLGYRTTIREPDEYSTYGDRRRSLELYSQWADQAWFEQSGMCANSIGGSDYAVGFHDGFVSYVYAGGTGEPPPVPPRRYWNAILRTEEGKQRADHWFDGYRHGARVAREGGFREMATVHSSMAGMPIDAGALASRHEESPLDGVESSAPPENVNALPDAAARSREGQFAKPPAPHGQEAQPRELAPSNGQPAKVAPSGNGVSPENPKSELPELELPDPPSAIERTPDAGATLDGPRQTNRVAMLFPSGHRQPSAPISNSAEQLARQAIDDRVPTAVADSTVRFVDGSSNASPNNGTRSLTSAATASCSKCDNQPGQAGATVVTCAAELPTCRPVGEEVTANQVANPFHITTPSPLTPRVQSASTVLFDN